MLSPHPIVAPPIDDPLDLGEVVVARFEGVMIRGDGLGAAPSMGRLVLTNQNLRFTSEGLGSLVVNRVGLPDLGGVLPSAEPRRLVVPIARVSSVEVERSLRVFHRLRLGLRGGGELKISLGLSRPDELVAALSKGS